MSEFAYSKILTGIMKDIVKVNKKQSYCVYCKKHTNHSSIEHKCRRCDKTGHTTGFCNYICSNIDTTKIYEAHECVVKQGIVCSSCTTYVQQQYILPFVHHALLQHKLLESLFQYAKESAMETKSNDIIKLDSAPLIDIMSNPLKYNIQLKKNQNVNHLTIAQLVKYINKMDKLLNPKLYVYRHYNLIIQDTCQQCDTDNLCDICLHGHCICSALFYMQSKCLLG